jgi:hypothetical protein
VKRITCLLVTAVFILGLVSCSQQNADGNTTTGTSAAQSTSSAETSSTSPGQGGNSTTITPAPSETSASSGDTQNNGQGRTEELLQSANADLDADGTVESIESYKVTVKDGGGSGIDEIEGVLRIKGSKPSKDIVFVRKSAGLTGVMSSMEIRDLDGDGAKDIVVIVPEAGAAFSLNYFFLYSYKMDKSYSYNSDSDLAEFANGFSFKYAGKGILEISSSKYGFHAKMNIADMNNGISAEDENNFAYENSWVEPVPVEISENSRLTILKGADGKPEIKVPLPIFGQATADMIGEVDLYYRVDSNFMPYMYRFEVLDFKEGGSVKAGGVMVK